MWPRRARTRSASSWLPLLVGTAPSATTPPGDPSLLSLTLCSLPRPLVSSPSGAHRRRSSPPRPPCPRRLTSVPIGSASSPHVDKPTATTAGALRHQRLRHLQASAPMTATVDLLAPAPPGPRRASPPNRGEPLTRSPLLPMPFAHSSCCFRRTRERTAAAKLAAAAHPRHPHDHPWARRTAGVPENRSARPSVARDGRPAIAAAPD